MTFLFRVQFVFFLLLVLLKTYFLFFVWSSWLLCLCIHMCTSCMTALPACTYVHLMYDCFACVCVVRVMGAWCLESRRANWIPWNWSYRRIGCKAWTWVPCKSSKCCSPLSCLSTPALHLYKYSSDSDNYLRYTVWVWGKIFFLLGFLNIRNNFGDYE